VTVARDPSLWDRVTSFFSGPASPEPDGDAPAELQGNGAAPPASAPVDHPSAGAAPVDVDALYDEFLERFKRDLLVEREQSGHLLIDNP
jgi:hypothetical protein